MSKVKQLPCHPAFFPSPTSPLHFPPLHPMLPSGTGGWGQSLRAPLCHSFLLTLCPEPVCGLSVLSPMAAGFNYALLGHWSSLGTSVSGTGQRTSYGMEDAFCQFGSAIQVMSPPSFLCIPSLLDLSVCGRKTALVLYKHCSGIRKTPVLLL